MAYWQATNVLFDRLCRMMAEAFLNAAQVATPSAFRVTAPFAGDVMAGALHRAYDEQDELPKDWRQLFDSLDRID
ncbi:hypothetical protein [Sphingomonas sp. GB1N7]|uniref:hypothetical protein n=1 Tax=Parasphingomonas caseinilytica TaxID=3096158 RepID=UPI002FC87AF6